MSTQQRAFVDKLLTNVSIKYVGEGFIADKILPTLNVSQNSGLLGRYGKSHLRIETSVTSGKNKYPTVTSNTRTTDSYLLTKHGLSDIVTEEDRINLDAPFQAEEDATEDLTHKLLIEKEFGLASTLTNTGIITQTSSPATKYGTYATSNPLGDFNTAITTIKAASGKVADTAIMSWEVFQILSNHPQILEAIKYTSDVNGGINEAQMAAALKVKRLLIGSEIYDSAVEGQTPVISPIWDDSVIFAVSPTAPGRKQIALGYKVQRNAPRRVFKDAINNPPNAMEIKVDDTYQQLLTDVTAAYLLKNVL